MDYFANFPKQNQAIGLAKTFSLVRQKCENRCACRCAVASGLDSGPISQSVAMMPADPGVVSSIPARSRTFVEIDHNNYMVIHLLPLIQEELSYRSKVCSTTTSK